jgi:ubiquinone/menaquinone biosynthesis C-methylase UbiE
MFRRAWLRLMRFGFWVLYNPLAWAYDAISKAVSKGYWHAWQRTALPELRGTRVLEIAHGTGDMLLDMAQAGYRPVGLDLSPAMGHIAKAKMRAQGASVPLVRGRAQQLPFACHAFDSLLCTFPASFVAAPETLRESARVLRPGGRAVVVLGSRLLGGDPWSRLLEWLYRVTAQRGPIPDLSSQLEAHGLNCRTTWVEVGDTVVLLALLELTARTG